MPASTSRSFRSGPWSDEHLAFAFVGRRVARLQQQLVEQVARDAELSEGEATLLVVLEVVDHDAGLAPSELTGMLVQTSGGTGSALRRLEERGLVTRRSDPDDGRGRRVGLTTAGHDVAGDLVQAYADLYADLTRDLDDDGASRLFDALVSFLGPLERRARARSTVDLLTSLARRSPRK